jgi:hypothetical protein
MALGMPILINRQACLFLSAQDISLKIMQNLVVAPDMLTKMS